MSHFTRHKKHWVISKWHFQQINPEVQLSVLPEYNIKVFYLRHFHGPSNGVKKWERESKKKRNSLLWLQQDINDRDETNQAWVGMASQPIHSNQCDCIELSASQSPIRQAKHTPVIHFPQFSRGVTSNVCVTCASIILRVSDGGRADSREPFQTVITHTAHSVCNWTVTEFLFFWLGAPVHWIWNETMLTLKLTFSTLTTQVLFHFKSNVLENSAKKNI